MELKKQFFALIPLIIGLCLSSGVHSDFVYGAGEANRVVRVGLEYKYKNVSSVPITNNSIAIGTIQNGQFQSEAVLSASNSLSVAVSNKSYIALNEEYNSYSKAMEKAVFLKNTAYQAVPAYLGENRWDVYIYAFNQEEKEEITAAFNHAFIAEGSGKMELRDGTSCAVVLCVPTLIAGAEKDDIITLGDRSYRGAIEFGCYNNALITAVNVVSMDEYLYSVIPSEMPPSYEIEALKAQAVAARTYAVTNVSSHQKDGYELCDGSNCQVYKGVDSETASSIEAAKETTGMLAYYNNKTIDAVFFASSGGYTENSENVWKDSMPYLRAVPDIYELDTNAWTKTITLDELTAKLNASGEAIGSAKDIIITKIDSSGRIQQLEIVGELGVKTLNKEEIRSFFSLNSRVFQINGKGSGSALIKTAGNSLPVIKYSNDLKLYNQALQEPYVIGSDQPLLLDKEVTPPSSQNGSQPSKEWNSSEKETTDSTEKNFPSVSTPQNTTAIQMPTVNVVSSATPASTVSSEGTFVFTGSGNGHGVGMSQKGAQGLAKQGYTYQEILKHYYTGITIQ